MYPKTPEITAFIEDPETSIISILMADFYKLGHKHQYTDGLDEIFITWTPRSSRIPQIKNVVAIGFQAEMMKYVKHVFDKHFFKLDKDFVVSFYEWFVYNSLTKFFAPDEKVDSSHIKALHELGHLPIRVEAVPEGSVVRIGCPMLTVTSTNKDMVWVATSIESYLSSNMWKMSTIATIAKVFKERLLHYADLTGGDQMFVNFQAHDFAFRGLSLFEDAEFNTMGHSASFTGTDNMPALFSIMKYYGADITDTLLGSSIPASEHSIVLVGTTTMSEKELLLKTITEKYPVGPMSWVSDTTDFWHIVTKVLPEIKDAIMKRDGKLVIRPDSGIPEDILYGNPKADTLHERNGLVRVLWDIFGGTTTNKGFKLLDSHIGTIYGDSITLDRMEEICTRAVNAGFATTNTVLGIGSYTYQYITRDTFGFAYKPTDCGINSTEYMVQKNPKTGDGTKKSQKGRVLVLEDENKVCFHKDLLTAAELKSQTGNMLRTIFENGTLFNKMSWSTIVERLNERSVLK